MAAYCQFASQPHPAGFTETYPDWQELSNGTRELWFKVATAALNGKAVL